ncbi:hypothetical protein SynA18461_02271 [Synechococcus sp. A18-46.1]|nr:hypothetical protein SynA18461_02271 [Synechococcus sp. A18-46.1]
MASRVRLRSRVDYEYAILWENVRVEYFTSVGDQQRADQCKKYSQELEWRLAMLPSADQLEKSSSDLLAESGLIPSEEISQFTK